MLNHALHATASQHSLTYTYTMRMLLTLASYCLIVQMRTTWKSPKVSVHTIGISHLQSASMSLEGKELRSRYPHLSQCARPAKLHPILPSPMSKTLVWAVKPLAH